jgi:hypothetical protein
MRYFKISLCRNFVRNDKGKKNNFLKDEQKAIGQKIGYDIAQSVLFFVIFVLLDLVFDQI